jgi:hypothetical protein
MFVGLFIGFTVFADALVVRNRTDHTNHIHFHDVHGKHNFDWSIPKGHTKSLTLSHGLYLQIVVQNEHQGTVCQVHLQEVEYKWTTHHWYSGTVEKSNYQPYITWTDCPSNVVHSTFDQENWNLPPGDGPAGPSYSTITINNVY